MKYFETLYIVNPNFEQSRLDTIIKDVEKNIVKFSTVIAHNIWGKKRLAYQIDNQKYGTFVSLIFETEAGSGIAGVASYMKLNISVLRAQTIRLKSRPSDSVLQKSISLDSGGEYQRSVQEKHMSRDESSEHSSADENTAETEEGELKPQGSNDDLDSEQE